MKLRLKGLWMAVCLALMVLGLTACSSKQTFEDSLETMTQEQADLYKTSAQSLIEQIANFSDEQIEEYLKQSDDFTISALESWKSAKDSLGAYESVKEQAVVEEEDSVTVSSLVEYEKADATVDLVLNPSQNTLTSMSFNVNQTLAVKLEEAGLNTLMGLGIVFVILFFLCFVISLFKHVSKLEAKLQSKEEKKETVDAPVMEQERLLQEKELVDDRELVAVISAAIAASENTSTDCFVVRSIRKSKNWKKA